MHGKHTAMKKNRNETGVLQHYKVVTTDPNENKTTFYFMVKSYTQAKYLQ